MKVLDFLDTEGGCVTKPGWFYDMLMELEEENEE